jgi:hypothetical protein
MSQDIIWSDLHRQVQENLVNFLTVEIDLAITLSDIAQKYSDRASRAELQGEADKALRTLRHFVDRIEEPTIRKAILGRANDMECRVGRIAQKADAATTP